MSTYGLYRIGIKRGKKITLTNIPIELWGNTDAYGNEYIITDKTIAGVRVVLKK